jgi:hypothetical protein
MTLTGVANADIITYTFSSHPSATNTLTDAVTSPEGPVVGIGENPAWYGPVSGSIWVGVGQTGDPSRPGFVVMPNGTVTTYFDAFVLPDGFNVQSATLQVLADDTASGWMNGMQLFTSSDIPANNCAAQAPGCWQSTMWTGNITPLVHDGNNILQLDVVQKWGSSTGGDWEATIVGTTPEPATFAFLGAGFAFIGFVRWRRRK